MVAFARAKAKSIFSKLRFTSIPQTKIGNNQRARIEEKIINKEKNSNYFLEAIKNGGIWLS